MSSFTTSLELPGPVHEVFTFLSRTSNLAALSPPEILLSLIEGPERLHLGARLTWKGRRWGISRRMKVEVTAFEEDARIVETQTEGPFTVWVHERRFEAYHEGTRLTDRIDFEPPAGMLGRLLSADAVLAELAAAYAYRDKELKASWRP